ncbi:hypothetical protein [Nonomuraea sp. NPDC052265]|uniref:hypothetical protein n=1 Tax=Nonomuraea sp. NPDC052265 TaxID=3364374 RepID=UPI0037CA52F6
MPLFRETIQSITAVGGAIDDTLTMSCEVNSLYHFHGVINYELRDKDAPFAIRANLPNGNDGELWAMRVVPGATVPEMQSGKTVLPALSAGLPVGATENFGQHMMYISGWFANWGSKTGQFSLAYRNITGSLNFGLDIRHGSWLTVEKVA